ncbi:MAG: hypothetical protein U0794_03740 [Isosphaeraceae bacterium]
MQLSRNESLVRSFVGALLALLASVVLGSGSARASCSHYALLKHADLSGQAAGLEVLELPSGPEGQAVPSLPRPPKPCTGVFCSGAPSTPELPAPPAPLTSDHWGLSQEPIPIPGAGSYLHDGSDARVRPTHSGNDVFHPPRHSAAIA